MIKKSIAILNSRAPFSQCQGKEALDVAMIMGSYEQPVSLFFHGEGVRQLIANQQPETIGMKDYLATFSALTFYDVEHLYVCEKSLKTRALGNHFHLDNVQVLSVAAFTEKLRAHATILRF